MEWGISEISKLKPMFSRSLNPTVHLPRLPDSDNQPEMEIGLFKTGSSNNYAVEWVISEISTLKPRFSGSPSPMELLSTLPDTDN